ncbi:MAG: PQQ-binding-like beta-propeller repeat protein [Candidatus Kapaibacterium sp.]
MNKEFQDDFTRIKTKISRWSVLVVSIAAILYGCRPTGQFQEGPINSNGGIGRTNSYESVTAFPAYEGSNEKIPTSDSLSGSIVPPLVLSSYQTVTASTHGTVTLSNSSMVLWTAKLDNDAFVCSGMCADAARNIYCAASDGRVYSFSKEGKRRFNVRFSDTNNLICTDILYVRDGIAVADGTGRFSKISTDGRLLWQWQSPLPAVQSFAADEQGSLYAAITHNDYASTDTVIKLSAQGNCEWKLAVPMKRVVVSPAVWNGKIYIGVIDHGNNPEVVVCSTNGQLVRTSSLRATPRGISVSVNGTVYCTGFNAGLGETRSVVQAFGADGKEKWYIPFGGKLSAPAMISTTNVAVVGVQGAALAVYIIDVKGVLDRFVSLDSAPSLLLKPAVTPEGELVFAGTSGAYLTRVGGKKSWLPI